MRNHILAAVIAAVLGIVLLSSLGLYIFISQPESDSGPAVPLNLFESELSARGEKKNNSEKNQIQASAGSAETEISRSTETMEGSAAVRQTELSSEPERAGSTESMENSAAVRQAELSSEAGSAKRAAAVDETEDESELYSGLNVPEHRIIFVGDSRTVGCRDAMKRAKRSDDCIYVGEVGMGCTWFTDEGIGLMADAIAEHEGCPVVLNLGVNDPDQIDQYLSAYHSAIGQFPDTDFYILSVNPVDEQVMVDDGLIEDSVLQLINNYQIALLNHALREEFPDRYIDSAAYLIKNGYTTVDGLHYSTGTYLEIHDYAVKEIEKRRR